VGVIAIVWCALGASAEAQAPFQVDAPEPANFSIVALDLAGGWGHSLVELNLRGILLTRAGFFMDVKAGGSWGLAEPGWGANGDALVGWAFSWRSQVSDAITTAELHAQFANVRVDAYEYFSGTVPSRSHFALVGGAKVSLWRGVYDAPFQDDTSFYYLRVAAGFEIGKVWGSWANRGGYRQFLWGYSSLRLLGFYAPQQGFREDDDDEWSRFGGAVQWVQTTRLGRGRTIFGVTLGLEPAVGWLAHVSATWPFYVGSFQ